MDGVTHRTLAWQHTPAAAQRGRRFLTFTSPLCQYLPHREAREFPSLLFLYQRAQLRLGLETWMLDAGNQELHKISLLNNLIVRAALGKALVINNNNNNNDKKQEFWASKLSYKSLSC